MSRTDACRACGGALVPFLHLGDMPFANSFVTVGEPPAPRGPLELALCLECTLVQITETVEPEVLFRQYAYFSSYSDWMVSHARELVARCVQERRLGPQHLAVELASNDGYLLQFYVRAGVPVLGIEPARNVAGVAESLRGVRSLPEFFNASLARRLRSEGVQADVLHANNVLAHVADLPGFVEGICTILHPEGLALIEVPYLLDMLDGLAFDTLYHEHLCVFSITALDRLFRAHGLSLVRVERIQLHGGSVLLFVERGDQPGDETVQARLAEEKGRGLHSLAPYQRFAEDVETTIRSIRDTIVALRAQGRRVAAYGAAAKGTVLLNACGIDARMIDFVVDRSPHKVGRLVPGVNIPIRPTSALLQEMPDDVLLLAWNFAEEILNQQEEYRGRGGRFWRPLPRPELLV